MKYVIVGSGVAGVSAAKEIIRADESGEITLITDEEYGFYYRPRLIQYLSGNLKIDDIVINEIDWFHKNGIDLQLGEKVESIDFASKDVYSGQDRYDYDKLLLASGAKPFVPPVEGTDLDRVFTLRDADDAREIYSSALECEKVVVIGGGLLGLESAYNLQRAGLDVTVVETTDYILNRQLDEKGGKLLEEKLKNIGINFKLSSIATEIKGENSVESVVFKEGGQIPADLVLFSTGIRPNTEICEDQDMEINRGIIVNEKMETSVENVFAAGDAAEYNGRVFGIWGPSMEMGKVAGKNMAGAEAKFGGYVPSHKLKVAEVNVTSLGILEEKENIESEIIKHGESYCRVFRSDDDKPVGAIVVGEYEKEDEIVKEIKAE
ncbi:nitrite reductase (NADH) large subunit [Halarsenatibacter silvermanii]|uniref:Nitrite reductase (NADH) large subunit n=1 Tax=Halarsenatibacter silvermanii TaxID=321763 RepID=A0A1G9JZ26_9FIRM|nr:nitrite reductase (NADH) large subunit [Halarsenatibacter silvermanii]